MKIINFISSLLKKEESTMKDAETMKDKGIMEYNKISENEELMEEIEKIEDKSAMEYNENEEDMGKIENNGTIKKEGETFIVDEIGDDEKYVFLTRESDGESFQEFDITDELYNEMLNNHNEILKLKYEDGAYTIVEN